MFGNILRRLISGNDIARKVATNYGDDIARNVGRNMADDVARAAAPNIIDIAPTKSVLSSIGDNVAPVNLPDVSDKIASQSNDLSNMLREGAKAGLNAPNNLTRAVERRMARESGIHPNDVIKNLYERTGISDVNKLENIADMLMGGTDIDKKNSLVSSVVDDVRTNFQRTGDPVNYVDLSDLRERIQSLAKEGGLTPTTQKDLGIIGSNQYDPIALAKEFRKRSAAYRGKNNPNLNDALANNLEQLGREIDDRIDASVTPENVKAGFDMIQDNLLHAQQQAYREGDKKTATALKNLAKEWGSVPEDERTVQNMRSKLADFVQIKKINGESANAKGGGALVSKLKAVPVVGDLLETTVGQPLTRLSQKTGEGMLKLADKAETGELQKTLKKGAAAAAGGTALLAAADNNSNKTDNTQGALNSTTASTPQYAAGGNSTLSTLLQPQQEPTFGGYTRSEIENAYVAALKDNNVKAASAFGNMLDRLDTTEKMNISRSKSSTSSKDKTAQKKEAGLSTLNTLLKSYERGGGGQGIVGGTLTNLLNSATGGAYNSSAQAYATQSRGAAAQIIKALGESGTLSDRDIQAAMDMLPKNTDSKQVAQEKINNLMTLLKQ